MFTRAASTSSGVRASTGTGVKRSSGLCCTHSTASTRPALQGPHADPADDAGPLGPLDRRLQAGGEHALVHAEIELVLVGEVAAAAVGALLHPLEALV